ncbi:substrate-binding domain-containing protein [Clostridium sp. CS001]|uniref:substrate-binding domain-containing protein n=1 Tax=Clostridium sp. CS001 TaxID=2880648 RepID=UPI001CF1D242|nr:substrate-binding domain-containing protein [Clostridium sp. CS001]MCB2288215.1 substrate-binding domain-containing protein [Clostridium sp. CS001]
MKKKILKTFSIIFCICLVTMNSGCKKDANPKEKQSKAIKIMCEDTVIPMVNDLVKDYNLNNDPIVTVESATRENAFDKLHNSEVDVLIGYGKPNDKGIDSQALAFDGVAIIVNPSNKLDSISTQELKQIYIGNIANWEKLNGESKAIVPVALKNNLNLIKQQFDMAIMDVPVKEEMSNSIKYVASIEEMKNFVAKDKNAIGFIPGQWYNKENKFLKISGIEITISNIKNELYTLRFPINIYYSKEKKDSLKDIFQYFKSDDGKKIIRKYCIEAF